MAIGGPDCVIKTDFGEWDGWDSGAFEIWDRAEGRVEWAEAQYVSHSVLRLNVHHQPSTIDACSDQDVAYEMGNGKDNAVIGDLPGD